MFVKATGLAKETCFSRSRCRSSCRHHQLVLDTCPWQNWPILDFDLLICCGRGLLTADWRYGCHRILCSETRIQPTQPGCPSIATPLQFEAGNDLSSSLHPLTPLTPGPSVWSLYHQHSWRHLLPNIISLEQLRQGAKPSERQ